MWICNRLPNLTGERRPPVLWHDVHPLEQREITHAGLSDDALEDALDRVAMKYE